MIHVEAAEHISRKERQFDLLEAVRPAMHARMERQKFLISPAAQTTGDRFLVAGLNLQGIPRMSFGEGRVFYCGLRSGMSCCHGVGGQTGLILDRAAAKSVPTSG